MAFERLVRVKFKGVTVEVYGIFDSSKWELFKEDIWFSKFCLAGLIARNYKELVGERNEEEINKEALLLEAVKRALEYNGIGAQCYPVIELDVEEELKI